MTTTSPPIWDVLDQRLDPTEWRPEIGPWVEVKRFDSSRGTSHAIVGNPRDHAYFRLTLDEADLLALMDGTRTVGEIVLEHLHTSGDLDLAAVAELVTLLRSGNCLTEPYVDVDAALVHALAPTGARASFARFLKTLSVESSEADRLVRWLHRWVLRYTFNRLGAVLALAVALGGLAAFGDIVATGDFHLTTQSVGLGFLILFTLNLAIVFVHELGHATLLVHYGRKVKSAGFRIYFGAPAFFVESSDVLMLDRGQRIKQAFAGPYFELVGAGVAAIVLWALPHVTFAALLYRFVLLNYLVLFMNLVPLLELDGYWILSDALQLPDLRPRSLAFIRSELWTKLRRREHFAASELGLGAYGFIGILFTLFSFVAAYFFWRRLFGGLVSKMWHAGPVGVVLLALLAAFIGGPVFRAAADLARSAARQLRVRWRRIRFRFQQHWRVEAATILDSQPSFSDLPVELLNDLAGRVRFESVPTGRAVVRQGERADAFYLVRRGQLEVVEEQPESGVDRVLRRVGPHESFGEIGLAEGAPRNATVRATSPAELFVVDKGTFDRLLAQHIALRPVAPTLQRLDELHSLPAFAHLDGHDLHRLAHHGRWVNLEPGRVLMSQGQTGGHFFAIASGRVEIVEDGRVVRERGPGEYVGDVALLLDIPRTATVRALTPVRAFRLDRRGFDRLVAAAFRQGHLRPNLGADRTWEH